jgi:hypothetical protein
MSRVRLADPGDQLLARPGGDAGGVEALADHEQRRDQHHGGVAEAGEGLFHLQYSGGVQRQCRTHGHQLHGQPVPDEQHHHGTEDQEGDGHRFDGRGA